MNNETKLHTGWSASPQYVIVRHRKGSLELLCISPETGEKTLPVFSLEELAQGFLEHRTLRSEWHVTKFPIGEMISLLLGPRMDMERVLPNPLPDPLAARDALLNSMDRESFVGLLLTPKREPPTQIATSRRQRPISFRDRSEESMGRPPREPNLAAARPSTGT